MPTSSKTHAWSDPDAENRKERNSENSTKEDLLLRSLVSRYFVCSFFFRCTHSHAQDFSERWISRLLLSPFQLTIVERYSCKRFFQHLLMGAWRSIQKGLMPGDTLRGERSASVLHYKLLLRAFSLDFAFFLWRHARAKTFATSPVLEKARFGKPLYRDREGSR